MGNLQKLVSIKLVYVSLGLFLLPVLLPKGIQYYYYIDIILTCIAAITLLVAIVIGIKELK